VTSSAPIKILSYNIHKGFTALNRALVLDNIKTQIHETQSDIVFLQEVIGRHDSHATPQFEYLADTAWPHYTYGQNAIYEEGHHGNAILSRYPFTGWCNTDISHSLFESRGLLHGKVSVKASMPDFQQELHLLCTHLGLFETSRKRQYDSIARFIDGNVPPNAPLILAGDFNDLWKNASLSLNNLGLSEVFEVTNGHHARTFPSWWPVLSLDRIYVRGVEVSKVERYAGESWRRLSDHLPLGAELLLRA